MHGTRVNWVGNDRCRGIVWIWMVERTVGGGAGRMILLADLLAMEVSVRKRDGKMLRIQCFEKCKKKEKYFCFSEPFF